MTSAALSLLASALAAAATIVLAIFAILQWSAMRENNAAGQRQNELTRERWKREDEERNPKEIFWLQSVPGRTFPELWCANVGTVSFLVSGIRLEPVVGEPTKIAFEPGKFFIVPVGKMNHMSLDKPEALFGSDRPGNCEMKLLLEGPSGQTESDSKAYHLWFYEGRWIIKDRDGGFKGFTEIRCPKCDMPVANFDTDGITSREDCILQINAVAEEFRGTCPSHSSLNKRVVKPEKLNLHG